MLGCAVFVKKILVIVSRRRRSSVEIPINCRQSSSFAMMKPKSFSIHSGQRTPIIIHEDNSLPKQKVMKDAKSNKFRRCVSVPTTLFDVESIMKFKTVDESLHSRYGGSDSGSRSQEHIQFKSVVIREYARTVGDNPSCSSGPPVS